MLFSLPELNLDHPLNQLLKQTVLEERGNSIDALSIRIKLDLDTALLPISSMNVEEMRRENFDILVF